ncbi:peptidylprolyl isomerase [Chitinilyticum piscinae]|uniref:Peptidyl-prolyl cis-trans isomerase n=1 Tax=Chitinilyticum piscinae TaxID=2866724 RepID=A0A8J7FQB0_9NEIS|nr:peptidylprolyl isomerase [Chitinilyticum piscinae]MBE9610304.1 peptidyl-prolyl cis-trans isomerase [Chitinilyticum piscinae]
MKRLIASFVLAAASCAAFAANPQVELNTSQGKIVLELYPEKAPQTVANFLQYVKEKQYDGVIFHRVISDFMIQGGGFTPDMKEKPTRAPIKNEANNGLKNDSYTIAMARTQDPHSASAQFFINVKNNDFLNFRNESVQGWGYAVFGKVVEGQKVVDKIKVVPTTTVSYYQDVPATPVVILSARELPAAASKPAKAASKASQAK